MQAPSIGESISAGWKAYKANWSAILVGYLCAWLVGLIPVVGGFWAQAGFKKVSLKAIRGQRPEPGDGFAAFDAPVDHLVIGLLEMLGLLLCCFGVYITVPLFNNAAFLIIDKRMTWSEAKTACMTHVWSNFGSWWVFWFVVALFGGIGVWLCIVGIFLTLPTAFCAMAYAYDRTLGGGKA